MPRAFNSTAPNLNWAVNRLNKSQGGILTSIGNLFAGGGSAATNANVERAVQWLIDKATNNTITYSLTNRHLLDTTGTSYDCSSFVITGFYAAGFSVSEATNTRDMVEVFTNNGFKWHPGSILPASTLKRGDILLKEDGDDAHTQVYIGNNHDVNCGGTPANVTDHSDDNWDRGGWDGFLRWGE